MRRRLSSPAFAAHAGEVDRADVSPRETEGAKPRRSVIVAREAPSVSFARAHSTTLPRSIHFVGGGK